MFSLLWPPPPYVAEIVFHSFESSVNNCKEKQITKRYEKIDQTTASNEFDSQVNLSVQFLILKCNVASFSGQKQLANVYILLTWRRWANFHLLTFWLCPLKPSTQLICGTYTQKKSFSPFTPLICLSSLYSRRLWVSCLLECDSYFAVMKATCASNFSCSWYPDVGFGQQQRWAPSFPVSHC